MSQFKPGDWVTVKPEHDSPAICRPDGKPTRGRVYVEQDGHVEVWVPIGGAGVDEHSQSCLHEPHMLIAEAGVACRAPGEICPLDCSGACEWAAS